MVGNNQTIHATESGTLKFGSISLPVRELVELRRDLTRVVEFGRDHIWIAETRLLLRKCNESV